MRLVQFRLPEGTGFGLLEPDGPDQLVHPLAGIPGQPTDAAVLAVALGEHAPSPAGPPLPLSELDLTAPLCRPGAIRDFMLFEEHVANSLRPFDRPVPKAWYRAPAFYFTCPHTVLATGATLIPPRAAELDYELELAAVIGRPLHDAGRDEALAAIAGFTLFNDFSARDLQAAERPVGLGPAKGKDFASALGPYLVTRDEIPGDPARPDITMSAAVNGRELSRSSTSGMYFDLADAIVYAARDSWLLPGDVVATGTVPSGCLLELRALSPDNPDHRWLRPGDQVVLTAAGLGSLATTIGERPAAPDETEG